MHSLRLLCRLILYWLVSLFKAKREDQSVHPKRRPASKTKRPRKPTWVNSHILHLAAFLPKGTGVRTIASHYNRLQAQHPKPHLRTISKSHVANVLQTHRAQVQNLRQRFKTNIPHPIPKNQIWGIDLTGKVDTNGQLHHILGILDHGTRRLLAISVLEAKTTKALNHKVLQTAAQHGLPKNVRTDNESNFKSKRFKRLFKHLGIKHQTTDLGCPWQNGRIERLWGTLKAHLNQIQVQNVHDLQTRLNEFATWYNEARPHQHLGGLTPMEAWDEIDPYDPYKPPKRIEMYSGWDGMLTGLRHRW
jgi:putative transposase